MKSELQKILEIVLKDGRYNFKIIEYSPVMLDEVGPNCLAITTPYRNSLDTIMLGIEIGRMCKRPISIKTSHTSCGLGHVWFWPDIPYGI